MASSETHDNDPEKRAEAATRPASGAKQGQPGVENDRSARRFTSSRILGTSERERLLKEAREVDFPVGLRGYDRAAVDRYVERVTRLITELEMSSSPESAVRHALEEVSEETRDILQRAHQTAEEITARSWSKAEERLRKTEREAKETLEAARQEAQETLGAARQEAKETLEAARQEAQETLGAARQEARETREAARREAQELRELATAETQSLRDTSQRDTDKMRGDAQRQAGEIVHSAEAHARDLVHSAESIWRERRRLLDDVGAVGEQLVAMSELEGKRFPRPPEEPALGAGHLGEQGSSPIGESAAAPHEAATP